MQRMELLPVEEDALNKVNSSSTQKNVLSKLLKSAQNGYLRQNHHHEVYHHNNIVRNELIEEFSDLHPATRPFRGRPLERTVCPQQSIQFIGEQYCLG